MKDLISIIVPIYNSEKTISKCIESVLTQTYSNIELLLINDGSSDNSESICMKYQKKDKRVKYLFKENGGVSSARNYGINRAKGKWIMFLDSDDYLDEKSLEDIISNNKDENILYSLKRKMFISDNIYKYDNSLKQEIDSIEFIMDIIDGNQIGVVWGYLYNASLVKKMKFDQNTFYLEDTLFLINYIKENKIKLIKFISNESYYNYVFNKDGITKSGKDLVKKCHSFIYSLDNINKILDYKYDDKIKLKKVRILEEELRLANNIKDYKIVCNEINIEKYTDNKVRFKVFSFIYRNKYYILLKLYYLIRKYAKKLKIR